MAGFKFGSLVIFRRSAKFISPPIYRYSHVIAVNIASAEGRPCADILYKTLSEGDKTVEQKRKAISG